MGPAVDGPGDDGVRFPMPQIQRILLVGHCGADTWSLESRLRELFKDIPVDSVDDESDLAKAGGETLLLVNRVLDGSFETGDGVELIGRLARRGDRPRMMLVSNYDWAQQQAVAAGAMPGFGKSNAHTDTAAALLRAAAGVDGGGR